MSNIKDLMGAANIESIFEDLDEYAQNNVMERLIQKMGKSYMHWINAVSNKPEQFKIVYAKTGSGDIKSVYWTGEIWCLEGSAVELNDTIRHYSIIE